MASSFVLLIFSFQAVFPRAEKYIWKTESSSPAWQERTREQSTVRQFVRPLDTESGVQEKSEDKVRNFKSDILILGAGMAGVAAAETLKKLGVKNLLVVEGSNRIGGRVKEVPFGNINVEVGANWVHHPNMKYVKDIPLDNMVKEAGLNFVPDSYEDIIVRYEGKNVTEEGVKEMERLEASIDECVELCQRKIEKKEPDINFRAALRLSDWHPKNPIQRASEYWFFDFEYGDEPEDTGLKNNAYTYKDHGEDDLFIADKRGFAQIIRNMAEQIPLEEGKNLHFNKYVTYIKYNEPGEYPIKVIANDTLTGEMYEYIAKWVIVTFSIGVLQSDRIVFEPKLPPWKEEVLYMFKMTRYIKIFLKFPESIEAFWDDNHYIMYVDPHIRGKYQMWQNLEARGKYFPKGTNILLCTVVGEFYDIVSTKTKEEVMKELYQVLKDMYGEKAVPPEDILIPDWHTNPLFFGSYSNWPIGISRTVFDNLDAPIGHFYFAGEAFGHNATGYLHGALQSGQKTAQDLYKCMMNNVCEKIPENGYGYTEVDQACPSTSLS